VSLLNLNVDDPETRNLIQQTVTQWIQNTVPHLNLPDKLELKIERNEHHLAVSWTGKVEAVIPRAPDPDLIRARLYDDHADVDLRFSGIRINYS